MNPTRVVLLVNNSDDDKIGDAIAIEFSKLGYNVALAGTDELKLQESLKNIKKSVPDVVEENYLPLTVDFRNEKQVESVVTKVVSKFGHLDILVNNLNYHHRLSGPLGETFFDDFNVALQVNLYAPTRLAQLAAPYLSKASNGGIIINTIPVADQSMSCGFSLGVIKAGLSMLTKTLANSFENNNVRCLAISSSTCRRDSPDDFVRLVVFLSSDKASYMNGTTIEVM
jgi:NAD(P)-dependent dehydrogenase (short-subunit alcohol dehydrogenase family)